MTDEGWEADPQRRRPWTVVGVILALVVLAALLVRPGADAPDDTGGDLEVLPEEPDAPENELDLEPEPPTVAVLHALSTAGLGRRVPPTEVALEGRTLRSAVTSRGRQLLALALLHPDERLVDVEVRDASSLETVRDLGRFRGRGPIAHLAISADGGAVVWLDPASGDEEGPALRWIGIDGAPPQEVPLPEGFEVRDVRAPRADLVAVLGNPRGARTPLVVLRVTGFAQAEGIEVTELEVGDVGEDVGPGFDAGDPVHARAGHVWDDRLQALHVAHAAREAVTTVDLVFGTVHDGPVGADLTGTGVVRRVAALTLEGDHVVASGTLTRPDPDRGLGRDATVPLEPLVVEVDPFGDRGRIRSRGPAAHGRVFAAARDVAGFWTASTGTDGVVASDVQVRDLDLEPVGEPLLVEGTVLDGRIPHDQTRVLLVRGSDDATLVSEHLLDDGSTRAERRFAPDATVHLEAVVVIERR